jgi:hypothetical protein
MGSAYYSAYVRIHCLVDVGQRADRQCQQGVADVDSKVADVDSKVASGSIRILDVADEVAT